MPLLNEPLQLSYSAINIILVLGGILATSAIQFGIHSQFKITTESRMKEMENRIKLAEEQNGQLLVALTRIETILTERENHQKAWSKFQTEEIHRIKFTQEEILKKLGN